MSVGLGGALVGVGRTLRGLGLGAWQGWGGDLPLHLGRAVNTTPPRLTNTGVDVAAFLKK